MDGNLDCPSLDLPGTMLLSMWETMKANGNISQRKLASLLGLNFDAMHGKIFREQKRLNGLTETHIATRTTPRVSLNAAIFDIETMDFSTGGVRNHLVCVCVLPLDGSDIRTVRLEFSDQGDDRRLLAEAIALLEEYDILIGHNIAAFDFNWLLSRLAYHGMPYPNKRWMYFDTYQAARRMAIKADRKSMAFLCDFFQVPYIKTAVLPVNWSKVDSRVADEFEGAMADIVFHCEEDVKANRNLFDVLWPLDRSSTNLPFFKK